MYQYFLCARYLRTRYIGWVSVVSVMIGVMTMIVVNSVMFGFREKMRDRLKGILSDVTVDATSTDGFDEPEMAMARIDSLVGDKIVAMTPTIEIFAMLHYKYQGVGKHYTRPIRLVGIDPAGRSAVGQFHEFLENPDNRSSPSFKITDEARRWRAENADLIDQEETNPVGAIIGHQIATYRGEGMAGDQYLIRPGQEVIVTTIMAGRPKPISFNLVVVDTFLSGMSEYDGQYVYMPYEELQRLRAMGNACASIQIKLKDYRDADRVVRTLRGAFPAVHYAISTWEDKQGPLLQAVKVEAAILNIILSFIIAVAGFGILAIFFMIVVEKTKDIGILKALGASNGGVLRVFLGYGLSLGVIGCVLGVVAGLLFTDNINPIEKTISRLTGIEVFPRDVYYFEDIPVLIDPWTVAWIVAGALTIAVLSAVLPARRAARLHPVEALRYE